MKRKTTTPASWNGRRVGILGGGKSGVAAARLLQRLGAHVFISDNNPGRLKLPAGIAQETGGHTAKLLNSDLLIRSPGVPAHLPILRRAIKKHIPVWSELELASLYIRPKTLVAITGTNGKTTTTTLVGDLFRKAGRPTWVAGNIGTPLSDLFGKATTSAVVVLEVSSYQLENIQSFHPNVSAILNITPDHLEHHGSFRAYVDAKARLFENQTKNDVCVLNADDPVCRTLARRCPAQVLFFSRRRTLSQGVYFRDEQIIVRWGAQEARWPLQWNLPGLHNVENALAATAVAMAGGVSLAAIRKGLAAFEGVEHRLERVRTLRGVRYVNDSKATNVDSTRVALESFKEPLILIMGGQGKGTPYTPLRPLLKRHAQRVLLIGEDAARIARDVGGAVPCERVKTLARAVRRAAQMAEPGDVVLLSPACASFDQYHNYEERGRHFKTLVQALP